MSRGSRARFQNHGRDAWFRNRHMRAIPAEEERPRGRTFHFCPRAASADRPFRDAQHR